ncbi:MAG: DUF523 domain-containing protein [Ghiorsea sp.]
MLKQTPKILISACLLGEPVRYDGGDCLRHFSADARLTIQTWQSKGLLLPLCPEVAGGLPVPRPAAEIQGELVQTKDGTDVTHHFERGAQKALQLCLKYDLKIAILKQGSPSCGNSLINDGSFSNQKIVGQGITTRLLQKHGVSVFNEYELDELVRIHHF